MKLTIFFWIALAWVIFAVALAYWAGETVWEVYTPDDFKTDNEV